jgi:hypothetical protein
VTDRLTREVDRAIDHLRHWLFVVCGDELREEIDALTRGPEFRALLTRAILRGDPRFPDVSAIRARLRGLLYSGDAAEAE